MKRRTFTQGLLAPLALAAVGSNVLAAPSTRLRMRDLYSNRDKTKFSEKAESLAGTEVEIWGYMAPPLKVDLDFFILSDVPADECPFCLAESDWIETIVFIRMQEPAAFQTATQMIWTKGVLDLGTDTDPGTGFVSRVRLLDATFGTV